MKATDIEVEIRWRNQGGGDGSARKCIGISRILFRGVPGTGLQESFRQVFLEIEQALERVLNVKVNQNANETLEFLCETVRQRVPEAAMRHAIGRKFHHAMNQEPQPTTSEQE